MSTSNFLIVSLTTNSTKRLSLDMERKRPHAMTQSITYTVALNKTGNVRTT